MPSLICSTRSMGLVGASEACRGFDGEVGGGAVVDFFFVISIRADAGARSSARPARAGAAAAGRRRHLLQRNSDRDRSEFSGKAEIGQALEQTICLLLL